MNPYQPPPQMPPQQPPVGPQQPQSPFGNQPQGPAFGNQPQLQPVPDQVKNQIFGVNQPAGFGRQGNMTIGGGIAGIASKSEEEGIKVYNDRSKYKEWEFIYDPRKDNTNALSGMGRMPGQPVNPQTGSTKPEDSKSTGSKAK
jgi:hypothetical protein